MDKLVESLLFVKSSALLVEPEKKWFEHKFKGEPTETSSATTTSSIGEQAISKPINVTEPAVVSAVREHARKLYDQDIVNYHAYREKTRRSDHNWIRTVLKSGTTGDKISANVILLQDSAVHNLDSLETLIGSVKLSKKRECVLSIDALKELFVNHLLPKRPLRSFNDHPFSSLAADSALPDERQTRDKRLLIWYCESLIKIKYSSFIRALQLVFQDTLATTKYKVALTLVELLVANAHEQCQPMYEMLVNKLGDPDYKVASKIVYHVKNYLHKCPRQKLGLLREIERLVSRQNISARAQYYGFCCMNQIILGRHDTDVANRLLLIYFAFFKKFIKTKEVDSRMLNALLTGVNRAYKYAKMDSQEIDNNLNTVFKLVHVTSFNVAIQALMLLSQVADARDDMLSRYYNALYRKMFDLEWRNTAKQTYFLNLLYNSLAKDEAVPRIKAFVKRLLQICFAQNVPFVCGSFMLVSELLKSKKGIVQLDHGLLVKNSLLAASSKAALRTTTAATSDGEDEEEKFVDVKSSSDDEAEPEAQPEAELEAESEVNNQNNNKDNNSSSSNSANSWVHKSNVLHKRHDAYDYTQRNPLYCGADRTLTYELLTFTRHYHPTVQVFANQLMNDEPIDYTGDPMEDFTLVHFLDRFVFKNPKKTLTKNKTAIKKSVFEPIKSLRKSSIRNMPINSKEYINMDDRAIPVEEKCFYDYYKSQAAKKRNAGDDDDDAASDDGSVSDSEFDAYLSRTEVDGADAANDDLSMDFAEAVSDKAKKKAKKSQQQSDDEDDFDDDDIEDDLLDDFENDEEFKNAMNDGEDDDDDDVDLDAQDQDDDDDENYDDEIIMPDRKPKRRGKESLDGLFAAADEFSELINESAKYDEMGVGSVSNRDRADPKQLRWEMKRDDFVQDKKWTRGGGAGKKAAIRSSDAFAGAKKGSKARADGRSGGGKPRAKAGMNKNKSKGGKKSFAGRNKSKKSFSKKRK